MNEKNTEVFCAKKICKYNSACCAKESSEVSYCTKDIIMINNEVECDLFDADYNKLSSCNKCLRKKGLATIEIDHSKRLNLTVKRSDINVSDFLNGLTK